MPRVIQGRRHEQSKRLVDTSIGPHRIRVGNENDNLDGFLIRCYGKKDNHLCGKQNFHVTGLDMVKKSYPDNIRAFSVSEELATASKLIQRGLKELQNPDTYQTFLYLPLLLLSNGFERFFKAIFCCWYYDQHQRYPTIEELKGKNGKKGHDLQFHLNRVLEACFTEEYRNRCQAGMQDYIFLTEDQKCLALMKILAEFGQRDRYYHLDVVVGERGDRQCYDDKWGDELERHLLEQNPAWIESLFNVGNKVHEMMAKEIIITIERATRGVARLMTLGNIGKIANMNSSYLFCFIKIMDSELGKRRY